MPLLFLSTSTVGVLLCVVCSAVCADHPDALWSGTVVVQNCSEMDWETAVGPEATQGRRHDQQDHRMGSDGVGVRVEPWRVVHVEWSMASGASPGTEVLLSDLRLRVGTGCAFLMQW